MGQTSTDHDASIPQDDSSPESGTLSKKETQEMVWKLLKSKAKFQMFNAFEMYGRMSLSELAEKMYKSKSTIHSHLQFLLKLGLIEEEKVALDTNANVYENYYRLTDNPQKIFNTANFDFKPFTPLTKEEVRKMIEPGISANRMMKSFFETEIEFLQTLLKNGIDQEALDDFNRLFVWGKTKDGEPRFFSRDFNSFDFLSDRDYFTKAHEILSHGNPEKINIADFDIPPEALSNPNEKKNLIITCSIPYGFILEYLNKQKRKAYHTEKKSIEE